MEFSQCIFNLNSSNKILFPLMALVDYRGFRLIAVSVLPISKQTIVYGSNDAGLTVHKKDPVLNELMKEIGTKLHLKEHGSGRDGVKVFGPGDLEIHLGVKKENFFFEFIAISHLLYETKI